MAEAKEGSKKKKGKLPVILAAVIVLAGGGYFMTKAKSAPPKRSEMILGEKVDLGDFVTPLGDGKTYLQLQVVVQLGEKEHIGPEAGGAKEGGTATLDPLARNAVLTVLRSTSPKEISTNEGIDLLKEKIAWQINHDSQTAVEFSGAKEPKHPSKEKAKDDDQVFTHVDPKAREYPKLDSDAGPVHVVMFTKFLPVDYSS